jgi:endonuclease/exonuclease/phosphatase family metal-dependent hydrolase
VALKKRQKKTRAGRRAPAPAPSPQHLATPHLCLLRAPTAVSRAGRRGREFVVATYNVHRWTGLNGRSRPDPARAGFVISELDADVIALQEVLRPLQGPDPLQILGDALGFHVIFAATRVHKRGELGNAILSRWPIAGVSMIDLSFSRLERRVAVAAQFQRREGRVDVVATHLALGDRTRHLQVRSLLEHPQLSDQATLLMGDMNAWRRCRAMRTLDGELRGRKKPKWPASFPSARPVLALDRIYSRGVRVLELSAHKSRAARRASDHLPIVARVRI